MAARTHMNNFTTQLDGGVSAIAVSIPVNSASGVSAAITAAGTGSYIPMTIDDGSIREIIWVTGATGNTLTAARGQEGTTPQIWPDDTTIECRATAQSIDLNMPIVYATPHSGSLQNTITKVSFSAVPVNLPAWMASSTYTPLKAGYYLFECYLEAQNVTVDTNLEVRLLKNGATNIANSIETIKAATSPPGTSLSSVMVSHIELMNGTTDNIEVWARHTGSGTKVFSAVRFTGKFLRG